MPFKTVIPNAAAVAMDSEPYCRPAWFSAKYSSRFARLFQELCGEIVQRSQWQATSPAPVEVAVAT